MAKVSLSKITPIKSLDKKIIELNGEKIEILQYLGAAEKAAYCERVISAALDPETQYISRSRLAVYGALELIKAYTNINITEKMMEDAPKTYDALVLNQVLQAVETAIPAEEYKAIQGKLLEDADHFEAYLHSIFGILKAVQGDYSAAEMDTQKIMDQFKNPEQYKLLTDILEKIG